MGYHRVGWVGWKRIIPSEEFEHFLRCTHYFLRDIQHVTAEDTPSIEALWPVPKYLGRRTEARPVEGRIRETQRDTSKHPCGPVIRCVPSVQLLLGFKGVLLKVARLRLSRRGQSCRCLRTQSTTSEGAFTSHTSGSASPLYFAASTSPSLRHSTSAYFSPRTNTIPTPPSPDGTTFVGVKHPFSKRARIERASLREDSLGGDAPYVPQSSGRSAIRSSCSYSSAKRVACSERKDRANQSRWLGACDRVVAVP